MYVALAMVKILIAVSFEGNLSCNMKIIPIWEVDLCVRGVLFGGVMVWSEILC